MHECQSPLVSPWLRAAQWGFLHVPDFKYYSEVCALLIQWKLRYGGSVFYDCLNLSNLHRHSLCIPPTFLFFDTQHRWIHQSTLSLNISTLDPYSVELLIFALIQQSFVQHSTHRSLVSGFPFSLARQWACTTWIFCPLTMSLLLSLR